MSYPIKFNGIKIWQISNWKNCLDHLMSDHTLNWATHIELYPNSPTLFVLELKLKLDQINSDYYLSTSIQVLQSPENSTIVSSRCSILSDNFDLLNSVRVDRQLVQGDECEFSRFIHLNDPISNILSGRKLTLLFVVTIEEDVSEIQFDGQISRFDHKWNLLHSVGPLHSYSKAITDTPVANCEFEWTFDIDKPKDVKLCEYYCEPSTSYCGNNFGISGKFYPKRKDGKCHMYFNVRKKMTISGHLFIRKQQQRDTGDSFPFQQLELKPGENLIKVFSLNSFPAKLTIGFKFDSVGEPETVEEVEPTVLLTKGWIEKFEIEQIGDDLITDVELSLTNKRKLYGHSFVLAAHSAIFANIFANDIAKQNGMFQAPIYDVNYKSFERLIQFYYTGEIPTEEIGEFLYAAHQYGEFDAALNKVLTNCSAISRLELQLYLFVIANIKKDQILMTKLAYQFSIITKPLVSLIRNSDVAFEIEKIFLFAHKKILREQSNLFSYWIKFCENQNCECTFPLTDISIQEFEKILGYLYFAYLEASFPIGKYAAELLYFAKKFEINKLKVECEFFLCENISADNCLKYLLVADKAKSEVVKEKCTTFIKENAAEIIQQDDFKKLQYERPELIKSLCLNLNRIVAAPLQEFGRENSLAIQ